MRIPVFNCTTSADGRSHSMAKVAHSRLGKLNAAGRFVDLREVSLPMVDPKAGDSVPEVRSVKGAIERGPGVILAVTVAGAGLNASAHNLIETTAPAWRHKVVGLMGFGESRTGFMAAADLVGSLLLEHQCHIVPRYVCATKGDFSRAGIMGAPLEEKIKELCNLTARLAGSIDLSASTKVKKKVRQRLLD